MAAALAPALLTDDHPLALELASLRAAASRYQHEAHATSLKLQRHSFETSQALDRSHALERENAALRDEVAALRAHPDVTPHPAALQVPDLTLALRKLSDKLDATEHALLVKTNEVVKLQSDLRKSEDEVDTAYRLEAAARAEAEEARAQTRSVERTLRKTEEEKKLVDLVVQEYADLVRSLEGRSRASTSIASLPLTNGKNDSSATLVDSLSEGKSGIKKLFEEFSEETVRLEHELARVKEQLSLLSEQLVTERARGERDRAQLAEALQDLERHHIDDNTAAKMVSRYMKFSQSTTDSLQNALENVKTRHAATSETLAAQLAIQQKSLAEERRLSKKLRAALDELTEDISREAYGRRREISLRLAFLSREEALAESLRRWIRRARETLERASPSGGEKDTAAADPFSKAIHDAEALLETLNGQPALGEDSPGSVARVILAQDNVANLTRELQGETDRRLRLQRKLADVEMEVKAYAAAELHAQGAKHDIGPLLDEEVQTEAEIRAEYDLAPVLREADQAPAAIDPIPVPQTGTAEYVPVQADPSALSPTEAAVEATPSSQPVQFPTTEGAEPDASVSNDETPTPTDAPSEPQASPQILVSPPEAPATSRAASLPKNEVPSLSIPSGASASIVISQAGNTPGEPVPVAEVIPNRTKETVIVLQPFPTSLATGSPEDGPAELSPVQWLNSLSSPAALPRGPEPQQDVFAFPSMESPTDETHISQLTSQLLQSSAPAPTAPSQTESAAPSRTELLASLAQAKHRYDSLQRAFRDCHLALKELKASVSALPPKAALAPVLQKAVERLHDYNEDARVELEIRVADEARIAQGFEALLAIPGALTAEDVDEDAIMKEVEAFVRGSDPAVQRAQSTFGRKLDDLQHDIACVKRAVYKLSAMEEDESSAGVSPSTGLASWTASFLGTSRPASPAPTFGAVMTSPRARYNSLTSHQRPSPHSRRPTEEEQDPFASLGLKIPMPTLVMPAPSTSPQKSARPRTVSTMYMLGLGARGSTFGMGSTPRKSSLGSSLHAKEAEVKQERDSLSEDLDSDVE